MSPRLVKLSLSAFVATTAFACGPWFPSTVIDKGDAGLLAAPSADFDRILTSSLPTPEFSAKSPPHSLDYNTDLQSFTFEAEQSDLRAAGATDDVIAAYRARRGESAADPKAASKVSNLPREFALYFVGARSYRSGDFAKARKSFADVLELPEAKRRYKTVWAAYMLGKCAAAEGDRALAETWFARTREFARAGFVDSTGLAAASFGEDGRLAYERKEWLVACEHYLHQHTTGDTTSLQSLAFTAARALAEPDPAVLASFAASPGPRAVMTAHLLDRAQMKNAWNDLREISPPTQSGLVRWVAALEKAGAPPSAEAASFALIAYHAGSYDVCARWLKLATTDDPLARWLNIKLSLRNGHIAEATDQLAALVRRASTEPDSDLDTPQLHGELAQLRLASRDYTDALRLLIRGHYWEDAAYVAERVLSSDELIRFVAAESDLIKAEPRLSALLARRLVRAGRTTEAAGYFSAEDAALLAEFTTHLQSGRDPARPAVARGLSLARAAELLRKSGIRLQAAELEPDNAYTDGMFPAGPSLLTERQRAGGLSAPTDDEIVRAMVPAATPNRRYHYRYPAADIAWEAAQLLPDNSTELTELLITAGGWLKARDPQAADRFYKALVNRCPDTDAGREARRLHWFPRSQ
jgi:hypothetical protein